ncbi:MAG: DUF4358 domain-containing protein [Lachnospiraceae bacterium]|nr:DUF4358 domain-containing protein [Lachnospiraceae bacterium]
MFSIPFKRAAALALSIILLLTTTACGKDNGKGDKREKQNYKDVSAYDLAMSIRESQKDFASGSIEMFDLLEPEDRDAYFEICYNVKNFSGSGMVSDFQYIGSATANADEIAVAVVPDEHYRDKVLEMYRFRVEDRIETFTGYAPEQVKKLKNAKFMSYDRYIIFLVCDDPESAIETIEEVLRTGKAKYKADPTGTATPTPTPTPSPSPEPTGEPVIGPIIEPTSEPGQDVSDLYTVYYRGKYESGFNPDLVTALRTHNRNMLTDPQDLRLYDYCRKVLIELFAGKMMDSEEAEKKIYQYIVEHVNYDYDHYSLQGQKLNSDNPYGAFFGGEGICTGYSTSFRLLCTAIGLEVIDVDGTAFREREAHGWNMIKLGPYWYYVDPCWGWDGSGAVDWSYFNVTADYMTRTQHYWEIADYPEADTVSFTERKKLGLPSQSTDEYTIPTERKQWYSE